MIVNVNKNRQIIVLHGMIREIARTLQCSERIVHSALRYRTNGKKSKAVRNLARKKLREIGQWADEPDEF